MAMSEIRKKYEVARFVLDDAKTDQLCRHLEINEAEALAHWHAVVGELNQHLGLDVEVIDFSVPNIYQPRLHECLVFLIDRIEAAKQYEVMGDLKRPRREVTPEVEEEMDRPTPEDEDASSLEQQPPAPSLNRSDGPLRVNTVLDDLALSDPMAKDEVDKRT